jgi:hypothetical protein
MIARLLLVATFAALPLAAGAQDVAFLSKSDTEATLLGKAIDFKRPSDGKELRWEFKQGGYLFADNRASGSHDAGTWEIKEDGALCTRFKGNSEDSCYYFYKDQGVLKRSVGKSARDLARSIPVNLE